MEKIECNLNLLRDNMQPGQQAANYLLADIIPPRESPQKRMGIDLVLVLDNSGSMEGAKIAAVKEASAAVVRSLDKNDRLGIVIFASESKALMSLQPVTDVDSCIDKIRNLETLGISGNTSMSKGLKTGDSLFESTETSRVKVMLVLTDGQVSDSANDCFNRKAESEKKGITLRGIGFGSDWNEEFLDQLDTRKQPIYVQQASDLTDQFIKEFSSLSNIVGRNAVLTFSLVGGTLITEANFVEPQAASISPKTPRYQIGNVSAAQGLRLLFAVIVPAKSHEGGYTIAKCSLEYTDLDGAVVKSEKDVKANVIADPLECQRINSTVKKCLDKIQNKAVIEKATALIKAGQVQEGTALLGRSLAITTILGDEKLKNETVAVIGKISKGGKISEEDAKTLIYGGRKTETY